jgi:hypothetical protein
MTILSEPYIRAIFPNGVIVGNCTINSIGDRANFVWDKRTLIDEDVIILAKYNCEETIAHLDDVITFEGWGESWSDTLRDLITDELRRANKYE